MRAGAMVRRGQLRAGALAAAIAVVGAVLGQVPARSVLSESVPMVGTNAPELEEVAQKMTPREIRDVAEYLSGVR